jgi:hypothetical protein
MPEVTVPVADTAPDLVPAPPDGGATRLADEMMAMFSDPEPAQPTVEEAPATAVSPEAAVQQPQMQDQLEPTERPSAEIDPADELLQDPMMSAEEESKRRWFNR